MTRLLFVGGPSRSGTTALADYLNLHEEILLCMERYKYVSDAVDPGFFALDRITDYEPGQGKQSGAQTNTPREYHEDLVAGKDPDRLKWIGDKYPNYVRRLNTLWRKNPGAKFILTYRPVEEVAESYEKRSKNPDDPWLGGRAGFEIGVRDWNIAMRETRDFIEGFVNAPVLIVGYHDFFYRNEEFVTLISRFLDLEFDAAVRRAWRDASQGFESGRREKEPLSKEQTAFIEEHKDHEVERWILARIARQWEEPELYALEERYDSAILNSNPRGLAAALIETHLRIEEQEHRSIRLGQRKGDLKGELDDQRQDIDVLTRNNETLGLETRRLEHQLGGIRSSRSWRLLTGIGGLRKTLSNYGKR